MDHSPFTYLHVYFLFTCFVDKINIIQSDTYKGFSIKYYIIEANMANYFGLDT